MQLLYRNEFIVDKNNNGVHDDVEKGKKVSQGENVDLNDIKVLFPSPVSLNLNNVNDQISNSSQTLDFISSIYLDEEQDVEKKASFRKQVVKDLLPNIEWDKMDEIYKNAMMDSTEASLKNTENSEEVDAGGDMGF